MGHASLLVTASILCLAAVAAAQQIEVTSHGQGSQDRNEIGETPDKHPFIRYAASRSSKSWVTTPSGSRVAVDDGITWKGRKIYMSLTWSLVATREDSDQALWDRNVSAFWDQVGIEIFERRPGQKLEVVALRSRSHPDLAEFRSLETGEAIGAANSDSKAPGTKLDLGTQWRGAKGKDDQPCHEMIRSAEEWQRLHARLFGDLPGAPPKDPGVDFKSHLLVVTYSGRTVNCKGLSAEAFENDEAVVLRVHADTYQSIGETPPTWPYGVFSVPLRPGKKLLIERNRQNLIGGPALWREWKRWAF